MSDIFTSVLNKDNAMDRMCKSIGPDTTAEILEKGKRAEIGEVRTWGGYKYQKTASGWVPFKESSKSTPAPKSEDEQELTKLGFKKYIGFGETSFEKEHNGRRVRVIQEKPGKSDSWMVTSNSKFLRDADGKAMSFGSLVEAAHEAMDWAEGKSKGTSSSTSKQDKEVSGYKPLIVKKTTKDGTTEKRDYGTVREFKDKNGNPTYSIQFENGSTWGNFGSEEEAQKVIDNAKKTSEEPKRSGSKAEIEEQIKRVEDEQDQIEETTQKNLLAIFKEELGPETVVNFTYPGDRAEIYLGKGSWDSITVKYSHLDRFSGDAGERKFGISVGVGSKTIELGSSYAKIISLANKLLTDTGLSDKVKSELINYQEAGHKLYKERRDLALKLRGL